MEHETRARRIVVGTDGSPASEPALRWAAREAADRGDSLDVVHAWRVPSADYAYGGLYTDLVPFEREGQDVLDRAVASLAELGSALPELRPLLVEETAAAALLRAAWGAELLVVGSRGRGGFVGLLLGSVSQYCVSRAPCSVAVVPSTWKADSARRIVVGVDGSEPSYGALHWAVAEAARRSARLDVVNAYDFDRVAPPIGAMLVVDQVDLEKASRALVEEMVAGALGWGDPRPTAVETISSPLGAARALIETAKGADLLVVGSRGRGSVHGLLLGSVSQQCVHHATCPVVVTRPAQQPEPAEHHS
jgi:nucleotide-binding universal stress UspA family protein